jgi:CDP-diacylglycerol--glycerol-3-phosphate 3-phosphatidyltransferase
MLDGRWREGVDRATKPLAALVRRTGVTADQITGLGLLLAVAAAALVASGWIGAGIAVGVVAGLTDLLDGPVAKASGSQSTRGAFFDSVADRVTDSVMLAGVAWYLASTRGAHTALLALGILAAANLVSYERAKAESLGLPAKGGLMERAERLIAIGLGLVINPLLVPILWAVLVLTALTAVVRFARVWTGASAVSPGARRAWREGRVDSRWRSWRERAVLRSGRSGGAGAPLARWRARRQGVMSSRASRTGRPRHRRLSGDGSARRRVTETLRKRVDGQQ